MNKDTTASIGIWTGVIIGVFFGTLYNSWVLTLILMNIMLLFIIIKLFALQKGDEQ